MIHLCETYKVTAENRASLLKPFAPSLVTKDDLKAYPFELLTDRTKLYFDYDEHSTDKEYIKTTRSVIRQTLLEHAGHYTNGFVFTESIHPEKISFHVIFKKIHILRKDFHPQDEQELFERLVGKERFHHIDTQVYGKKLWFRVPYGTTVDKPYSHEPVVPQGQTLNLADYLVSVPDDTPDIPCKFYATQLGRQMAAQCKKDAQEYQEEDDLSDDDKRKKYIEMIKLLNPQRFKTYNMWLALLVFMKSHKLPRDLFIELSEASGYERFDEVHCIQAWNQCKENSLFGPSLIYGWLKQDGVKVKELFPTKSPVLSRLLKDYFTQHEFTDKNIAETISEFYQDHLFYTTSHGWIRHNGSKWVIGDDHTVLYPIMLFLTQDLHRWVQQELKRVGDDEEKRKPLDKLVRAINTMESQRKMSGVVKILRGIMTNDTVLETFDMKPHWICFDNQKAIDMMTGQVIDIAPTDRILTTTGYDYVPRSSISPQAFHRVASILHEIMPEEEYDLFLKNTAVFLYGGNTNEIIVVWKGVGRNGKGVVASLLKKVLGKYFVDLPIEELTQESKGTGRASSEIARLRWARCVCATEPEAGSRLIVNRVKALTGKDTVTARHLHQEAFSYTPKFTMLLQCNDMPMLSRIDEGIENRLKPQEFPHKFVDQDELHLSPSYRLKDPHLKDSIDQDDELRHAFLWMLLDAFKESKGIYTMNQRAKEEHDIIMKDNNPLTEFLRGYTASEQRISLSDLYETYKVNGRNDISKQKFNGLLTQAKVRVEKDHRRSIWVYLQENIQAEQV